MKQAKSQKIGSLGQSIIEVQVQKTNTWIARNLTEDFGIDLELEYAPNDVKGMFIKAQIKAHENVKIINGFVSQQLSKSFLRYCNECRIPVILIVVSTSNSMSWYVWIQKWIIENSLEDEIYNEYQTKSVNIKISTKNDFSRALNDELVYIANWENKTQLYISLNDLAQLSFKQYYTKLSQMLFDYIDELESKHDNSYFNKLLDRMIDLGASMRGTLEGNKIGTLIYDFVRHYGNKLNLKHIERLIVRGNSYSRTGLNAISIMYEEYPEYTKSLGLPAYFNGIGFDIISYYCEKREEFLDIRSPFWIRNVKVNDNDKYAISEKFDMDKWINRGESAIIDYIYKIND